MQQRTAGHPLQNSRGDFGEGGEEDLMVHCVKRCQKVQQDEYREVALAVSSSSVMAWRAVLVE